VRNGAPALTAGWCRSAELARQCPLEPAVEPGRPRDRRLAQVVRADHRRTDKRHQGGDDDANTSAEISGIAAGEAPYEQRGMKAASRFTHLEMTVSRSGVRSRSRLQRRKPALQVEEGVEIYHDGVVFDHEADRDRERNQGQMSSGSRRPMRRGAEIDSGP